MPSFLSLFLAEALKRPGELHVIMLVLSLVKDLIVVKFLDGIMLPHVILPLVEDVELATVLIRVLFLVFQIDVLYAQHNAKRKEQNACEHDQSVHLSHTDLKPREMSVLPYDVGRVLGVLDMDFVAQECPKFFELFESDKMIILLRQPLAFLRFHGHKYVNRPVIRLVTLLVLQLLRQLIIDLLHFVPI